MKFKTHVAALFIVLLVQLSTAFAQPPGKETNFMDLMYSQLGVILKSCDQVKGEFLEVKPLTDGGPSFINSIYLVTTTAGEQLILKISNPIWKGEKTLNEVLALKFLKVRTSIPVPTVYAYENDATKSLIECEFILMPRIKGKPLNAEISTLYQDKFRYHHLLNQLAEIIVMMKSFSFHEIGNFQFDANHILKIGGVVDFAGYPIENPCKHFSEYAQHALSYYVREMETLYQKQTQDQQLYEEFIPILKDLLEHSDFKILNHSEGMFVLSHQDFVMKNILVDGCEITGIVDWEWAGSTLKEFEPMTGFDFLFTDEDRAYFAHRLESLGISNFFNPPTKERSLFYKLLGEVYTLVAFREWREGKLEHTAKFLNQKLEQRKIRNSLDFDIDKFINDLKTDLKESISAWQKLTM